MGKIEVITPSQEGKLVGILNNGFKKIPTGEMSLNDLKDVQITNIEENDMLVYEQGMWINKQGMTLDNIYILDGGNPNGN